MEINDYQKEALAVEGDRTYYKTFMRLGTADTMTHDGIFIIQLLEGVMGLSRESGEVEDVVSKYLFQGHELDREHLMKELGDVAWFLAECAEALGCTMDEILKMNLDKIHKRYPNGFREEDSIHRQEGDI